MLLVLVFARVQTRRCCAMLWFHLPPIFPAVNISSLQYFLLCLI